MQYEQRKREEKRIKFEQEQKQKLKLLDEKVQHGRDSDDSAEEQKQQSQEISDKVDALHQFQLLLPLAKTKISDFFKAMTLINDKKAKEVLRELKNYFQNDPNWQNEGNSEIDLETFFGSCLFRIEGDEEAQLLDWKLLSFFALYTCK